MMQVESGTGPTTPIYCAIQLTIRLRAADYELKLSLVQKQQQQLFIPMQIKILKKYKTRITSCWDQPKKPMVNFFLISKKQSWVVGY